MNIQNPNLEWYSSKSKAAKVFPRCPIASIELCPRYYDSTCLLGNVNIITKISNEDEIRLNKKWSSFRPVNWGEQAGISSDENELSSIRGFCPEVAYNAFGIFATTLYKYSDELDMGIAHQFLRQQGLDSNHPQWEWSSITPFHYIECQEYSVFSKYSRRKPKRHSKSRSSLKPKLRWQILVRDNFTCQYCGQRASEDVILEVDHKISVADGGSNEPDNLITACRKCNQGKGAESIIPVNK